MEIVTRLIMCSVCVMAQLQSISSVQTATSAFHDFRGVPRYFHWGQLQSSITRQWMPSGQRESQEISELCVAS